MTRSWTAVTVFAGLLFSLSACQAGVAPSAPVAAPTFAAPTANAPTAAPIALFSCPSRTLTWDGSSAIDLTGTWSADDEGVYYLRELDDQVWWLGMSGLHEPLVDRGTRWTNVYRGTRSGDTVTGTYADVPAGGILDSGPVVWKLTRTSAGGISLVRTDPVLETGFGGTLLDPMHARMNEPRSRHRFALGRVAPAVGFEPTTLRLTAERSTTELRRNGARRARRTGG